MFAEAWALQTGDAVVPTMQERIYVVESVKPVNDVPGSLRRATAADRELLLEWNEMFIAEAFGEPAKLGQIERAVEARLDSAQSGYAFWDDGGPVCLVGFTGPTPDGIRIGPVYTPPEFRRRGYASAATAALSQQLIDEGRRFCMLYTDRDNHTSNHIYQEIGFEPVADVAVYSFRR
jgi:predicted GNAT family acetyltransferase